MPLSVEGVNRMLRGITDGTLQLHLHTAMPPTVSNRVTGSGYAAVDIEDTAWTLTTTGGVRRISNTDRISFPTPGGTWGTAAYLALWDGATLLWWDDITTFQATANGAVSIPPGGVAFGLAAS